jgi:four helix bundle protein
LNKSFDFAVNVVNYSLKMIEDKEFIISRQLMKSGTSIGANVEEAQGAISKAEFIAKMQISLKEARETNYWLRVIQKSDIVVK